MKTIPYTHVITGAAGFLGSHLLKAFLEQEDTHRVVALARSSKEQTVMARVKGALKETGWENASDISKLDVYEADITHGQCGLTTEVISSLQESIHPIVFWHSAASLRWEWGRRESVFRDNLEGTRNALALAKSVGASLFVYISTAYTCGTLFGDIPEELHSPSKFNNVYEESKHAAEKLVLSNTDEDLRVLVLRPSIIVGHSETFRPSGSYTGLYGFLKELRRFKKMLADSDESVRYPAQKNAVLSFIPVDHVIEDAIGVVRNEITQPTKRIYHLTSSEGPLLEELADYSFDCTGLKGRISLVDHEIQNASPLERFFARRMAFFSGYTGDTKSFMRSRTLSRSICMSDMKRFIDGELEGVME